MKRVVRKDDGSHIIIVIMDSATSTSSQPYRVLSGVREAGSRFWEFMKVCGFISFILWVLFVTVVGVVALGISAYARNHRYKAPFRTDMDSANEAAAVSAAIGLLDTHWAMNQTAKYIPDTGPRKRELVPDLWDSMWNHTYGVRLMASCGGLMCPDRFLLDVHHLLAGGDTGRIVVIVPMDTYECKHCVRDVLYLDGLPQEFWPIAPQTVAIPYRDPDITTTRVANWVIDMDGGSSRITPRAWDLMPGPNQWIQIRGRRFGYLLKPLVQGATYKIQ